ncbi:putative arsenite methyltransferase [Helianthus annuus]|nr:putative arsenite methyltransferase [Helianthus annuus]
MLFYHRLFIQFAIEADLGLGDAYINGDFSFVDEEEGLLNTLTRFRKFFMEEVVIYSFQLSYAIHSWILSHIFISNVNRGGWWTPLFLIAGLAFANEMLEAVGHEYKVAFFGCSELALANFRPARGTPYRPLQISATPRYSAGPIIGNGMSIFLLFALLFRSWFNRKYNIRTLLKYTLVIQSVQ